MTTQTLSDVDDALEEISNGAPYKIMHLSGNQYQILVENDKFHQRPDQGHDPYYSIEFTARAL
jgi:hypothetical protein